MLEEAKLTSLTLRQPRAKSKLASKLILPIAKPASNADREKAMTALLNELWEKYAGWEKGLVFAPYIPTDLKKEMTICRIG